MALWALVRTSDLVVLAIQSGPPSAPASGEARRYFSQQADWVACRAQWDQANAEGRTLVLSGHSSGQESLTHDFPQAPVVSSDGTVIPARLLRVTANYDALTGGTFALSTDNRPTFKVSASKTEVAADGTDSATVTVTRINPSTGATNTGFSATVREVLDGRRVKLAFSSGVATFTFRTRDTGPHRIQSTSRYRIVDGVTLAETPFLIEADD